MNTKKGLPLLFAAVLGLAGSATAASAAQALMHTGGRTTQPVGHYELCQRQPVECRQRTAQGAPIQLTRSLWAQVVNVNNTVNVSLEPRTDMEMWGVEEVWSYPDRGMGDCEDYALEKRRELMALGFPPSALLMTVVRQPNGDGHAVLTIRTSKGDFILDNLEGKVLPWFETDYTFLKRQSEFNSGTWVQINDGRDDAVASLR